MLTHTKIGEGGGLGNLSSIEQCQCIIFQFIYIYYFTLFWVVPMAAATKVYVGVSLTNINTPMFAFISTYGTAYETWLMVKYLL